MLSVISIWAASRALLIRSFRACNGALAVVCSFQIIHVAVQEFDGFVDRDSAPNTTAKLITDN